MNEEPTVTFGSVQPGTASAPYPAARWGPFTLLARVGAGGFGEVFRAWDPGLQREVALKLLLPGSHGQDDDAAYEATLREARALASVQHPNIVSIYGVDRHDGRVGFWTDFIRGKTLSSILGEHGPFGFREAAMIGLDLTRALSAVHRLGLLHCDIKPENVMREEGGRILLMDFGLCGLPQRGNGLAGTPNYMAPELFTGASASVMSDIHAVGVLLYYLTTGAHPSTVSRSSSGDAVEVRYRVPLMDRRSDLPDWFVHIVSTAIDPDPAKRFASAGQMAEALAEAIGASSKVVAVPGTRRMQPRRILLFTAGLLLLAALGFGVGRRLIARKHRPNVPAYVDGGSYDRYLQAQALLAKSYQMANVNAAGQLFEQLTRTDPQFALGWAGLGYAHFLQYGQSHDSRLLDRASTESNRALTIDEDTAPAFVTLARVAAMEGNNALALHMADEAVKLDATSPEAVLAQAAVYAAQGNMAAAETAAQKAMDLAPDDWHAPLSLADYYLSSGKLDQAEAQFKRSAELAPDNEAAYYDLAIVDMRLNKLKEARANIERALQIEPDSPDTYQELAWLLEAEGKFDGAVAANRKAADLEPNNYQAWANLGATTLQLADGSRKAAPAYQKAAALAEAERQRRPKDPELLSSLAYYYARGGNPERARTLLRQSLALGTSNPKIDYVAGEIYEITGDRSAAIEHITKAIGPGYSLAEIDRDPDLKDLRTDPAFQAKLKAIGSALGKNPVDTPGQKR